MQRVASVSAPPLGVPHVRQRSTDALNDDQRNDLRVLSPLPTLDLALLCLRRLKPRSLARMLVCGLPVTSALWAMPELVAAAPSRRSAAIGCALLFCVALGLRAWFVGGVARKLVTQLLPLPATPDSRPGLAALAATVRGLPALAVLLTVAFLSLPRSLWALPFLLALWLARAVAWPAPLARAACSGMAPSASHLAAVLASSAFRDGAGRRGSLVTIELLLLLFTLLVALNLGGLALVLGGVLGLAPLSDSPTLLPFPLRVFRDDPAWAFALLPLAILCMEPLRIMVTGLVCVRRLALDGAEALAALDAVCAPVAPSRLSAGVPNGERSELGTPADASLTAVLASVAIWLLGFRIVHAWQASSDAALGLRGDALPALIEGASRSLPVAAAVLLYGVALFYVASLRTPPLAEPRSPALLSTLSSAPELELRARLYRLTGLPGPAPVQAKAEHVRTLPRLRYRGRKCAVRPPRPLRRLPRVSPHRPMHRPQSVRRREALPALPTTPASIRVVPSMIAMGSLSVVLPLSALMPILLLPLVSALLAFLTAERVRLRQQATIVTLHGPRAFVVGQPGVLEARLRGPLGGRLSRLSIQVEFAGGLRGPWTPCVLLGPGRSAAAITLVASGRRDASVVGVHVRGELRSGWLRAALSFACPREVRVLQRAPRLPAFNARPHMRSPRPARGRIVLALDVGDVEGAPLRDPALLSAGLALAETALSLGATVGLVLVGERVQVVRPLLPGRWGLSGLERELRGATSGRERSDLGALFSWAERNLSHADTLVVLTAPFAQREALGVAATARAAHRAQVLLCGSFADELELRAAEGDPYVQQAAQDMLAERRELRRAWSRSGIDWVDAARPQLAVCLLRRYLDRRPPRGHGRQR